MDGNFVNCVPCRPGSPIHTVAGQGVFRRYFTVECKSIPPDKCILIFNKRLINDDVGIMTVSSFTMQYCRTFSGRADINTFGCRQDGPQRVGNQPAFFIEDRPPPMIITTQSSTRSYPNNSYGIYFDII